MAVVGRPSASSGTSVPAAAALLAASGPATPSMAPWPNSLGSRASRRSTAYERNVGISAPPAGSAPSGKPIAAPRSHGFHDRAHSSRVIHSDPRSGTISASNAVARRGVQHLADGEQSDRDDDDVDAVEQLRNAEGEPRHAGERIDPDHPEQEPEQQAGEAVAAATRRARRTPPRTRGPPARSTPPARSRARAPPWPARTR